MYSLSQKQISTMPIIKDRENKTTIKQFVCFHCQKQEEILFVCMDCKSPQMYCYKHMEDKHHSLPYHAWQSKPITKHNMQAFAVKSNSTHFFCFFL